MTNLLKTAAIAALITGFANGAQALEVTNPLTVPGVGVAFVQGETLTPVKAKPVFSAGTKIGVARLDGGRLIPAPHGEVFDWELLDKRSGLNIEVMNAGDYLKYIPEIPFDGIDTDNKIDEIRLAAANEGYSHVILYGMATDSYWASFGGKALSETGLTVHEDCNSWDGAKAKALLVDSYTGKVLGAATSNNVTYNIGYLADDVERLLTDLT